MIAEIKKYIEITNSIDIILKETPYKLNYIIEKVGIKKPTFFKKLKDKRFSPEELLEIAKIIDPLENQKIEIKESIDKALKDIEEGRVKPHNEIMKEARQRIENRKNADRMDA
ncbi:hypothetical protein [Apibacter sp. HY039]|uniref:hypothetical protein n=1 Tax=Apibacter sp. HY039 TaxID=2501476 RepID=UPI000FEBA3FD|nr:hypothetical protein [Apibacter sp. HY039]